MISRRKLLSSLGLATAVASVPSMLMVPDAEAQTVGMERRQDRSEGRRERREDRRDCGAKCAARVAVTRAMCGAEARRRQELRRAQPSSV